MIMLQKRDRELLRLTYEQQFLSVGQAHQFVYPDVAARIKQRRIFELERAGLIRRERGFGADRAGIIRLTQSGIKIAEIDRCERVPQLRKISAQTFFHDALVTSVRLRLAQFWGARWIPERLIKAESFAHIPDGVLVFPTGSIIAIEIENSPKGPKRFREIQERWRANPVKLCLYVASSEHMHRVLKKYLEAGPRDLPFGLISWSELERGAPPVWMPQGEIDIFSTREL
jgi:DNA-binding MarR family transcriptional regulator